MEDEPLLTGSINRGSGDYGSHDSDQHEESSRSGRLSYSVTDDSEEQGMYSLRPETSGLLTDLKLCSGLSSVQAGVMFTYFLFLLSDKHTIVSLLVELPFRSL